MKYTLPKKFGRVFSKFIDPCMDPKKFRDKPNSHTYMNEGDVNHTAQLNGMDSFLRFFSHDFPILELSYNVHK